MPRYPVIAVIIVGGLIILSIIWCIARCACCGLSCCCECFYCLKCCGNCCGMCDAPKKRHKHLDDEPYLPPGQGYRSEAPMTTGAAFAGGFKPAAHEPPQYAEFDISKKGAAHEDALPAMPSWEGTGTKKVLVEDGAVEMENLKKPDNAAQSLPLMAGASRGASPASPDTRGPYGAQQDDYGASNPYLAAGAAEADPYAMNDAGYDQGYNGSGRGYGPSSSSLGVDQYGMAGAGAMGPGRRSPRGYAGDGYAQNQGYPQSRPQQGSYDDYRRNGASPQPMGYDMDRRSPRMPDVMGGGGGYGDQGPRRSPAPPAGYGRGGGGYEQDPYRAPQRQYSSDSTRPLARPSPQHQNSYGESPSPNLQNNSGFDFNSGYSRPNTRGRDESYDYSQPQQAGGQQGGYPGYKAYTPQEGRQPQGWSGL